MPGFTLNISPARVAQVVLGGAALVGGYQLSSSLVRSAYRDDLLGDPTRIVEVDGRAIIFQNREAQGGKLTNVAMGAGAAAAFGGAVLTFGAGGGSGVAAALRLGGGVALFALGLGAITGATAISAQYQGTDFVPVR